MFPYQRKHRLYDKDTGTQLPVGVAARAIMIGVLSNTLLKLLIAVFLGSQPFRRVAAVGLSVIAIASGLALVYFG